MKHLFTDKARREKLIKTILLILAGIAILLGATFAWNDLSQHKTDLSDGNRREKANERNVTLNDNAPADPGWTEGNTVTKELSATNLADSGGLVCVRLSLKEFMELRDYQTELFYTVDKDDPNSEKILFATFADGSARQGEYMTVEEAVALGFEHYGSYEVPEGLDPETGEQVMVEYATTNTIELRNGIYGKPMLVQGDTYQMWGDAPRANVSHNIASTAECDYTPYFWDKNGAKPIRTGIGSGYLRDYVTLNRDENLPEMITLNAWSKNGGTETGHGRLRNVWVVDEKDGWVYWADRLAPGESTDNLLDSVTFGKHPSEHVSGITDKVKLDYFIHTDMQATDESQEELIKVFGEIDDPTITTIQQLEDSLSTLIAQGKITKEKFDLIRMLAYGMREVTFEPNLPQGVDPRKLRSMPDPLRLKTGETIDKTTLSTPTINFADQRYRFAFWSTDPTASPTDPTAEFAWGNPVMKDTQLYAIWKQSFRFKMRIGDPNIDISKNVNLMNFAGAGDFIVDWGAAGTVPNQTTPGVDPIGANKVHYQGGSLPAQVMRYTYTNTGAFTVTIEVFGEMPAGMTFDHYTYEGGHRLTEVLSPVLPSNRVNASLMFADCFNLTEIPEGLFANNPQVTNFMGTFRGCPRLTEIPEGLFANNPNVTNFELTFYGCTKLTEIPARLFEKNTRVITFKETFSGCKDLNSIPELLFAKSLRVETFRFTFRNCESLEAIPEGLFEKNTWVTTFQGTFGFCKGLEAIPEGLFAKNRAVTDFTGTFRDCSSLKAIPAGLFEKNPDVQIFRGTFAYCFGLKAIPEGLVASNTKVTDFGQMFVFCSALTSIPAGLFASNPRVTDFAQVFAYCLVLTSIPEGLFDHNPLVITFQETFLGCVRLASVPTTLFDNNKAGARDQSAALGGDNIAKINFSKTFFSCIGLGNKTVGIDAPAIWETHMHVDSSGAQLDPLSYQGTGLVDQSGNDFIHNGQTWG